MQDHQNILEVNKLSVSFRSEGGIKDVLHNVSFNVRKGEILGLVGESGSGKSVSSMTIMGLLPSTAIVKDDSTINLQLDGYDEVDILKMKEEEHRKLRGKQISMIFQEPMTSLNPIQKCGEQVAEILILHQNISRKQAKQRVIELFEEVMLPRPTEIYSSYPHQISGGQKQRVMIAMALANEPSLLIADEPTTALDVTVQKTILELLKKLQEKYGMSVIFITHDLGVIAELADRVIVMRQGNIVESGEVEELFTNAKHPYTQGLIACRPPVDQRPEKLPTVSDFENTEHPFEAKLVNAETRKEKHKLIYSKEPILEVSSLNTRFPAKRNLLGKTTQWMHAVNDVNFEVYQGETLGLVGESGCGKTTLGRSLLKMVEHSDGDIIYRGKTLNKLSKSELREMRSKMQLIFQDPYSSLNPRITIGQAIMEPMRIHGLWGSKKDQRAKAIELLERVSLGEEHFHRYPHEFSGGQRQRIVIARTLAMQPEFIICDESVSALDVSVQAQVLNLLNELKEEFKFTYIFISHDLSVVRFLSDRIIVMQKGKIVEMGEADELYTNPKEDYTRDLISAIPLVHFPVLSGKDKA
jgi:peptide/nickel transport system ATP-binding protein